MKIIDAIISQVEEHPNSGSSRFLGTALASACNPDFKVSLLDASVKLDAKNKLLFGELMNIAQQPDFSNADQDQALHWLGSNGFI